MTELKFVSSLPKLDPKTSLLLYDKRLEAKHLAWIKRFPLRYGLTAGEGLKDLGRFPSHLAKILNISQGVGLSQLTIVALGGGSVGDFAGFAASVLKRGVGLVHIPSTWLSAMDSAHGGKTALNVGKFKNQVGTFYPANMVYHVKDVLLAQPEARGQEALGELIKISLLNGGALWKQCQLISTPTNAQLWQLLPTLVKAKYKIVNKDPFEKKGIRHLLNLGHTLGHAIELELKIPHGLAVLAGTRFAVDWSHRRGLMPSRTYSSITSQLPQIGRLLKKLKHTQAFLLHDKKLTTNSKIRFIFLQSPGTAKITPVSVVEILSEVKRQTHV